MINSKKSIVGRISGKQSLIGKINKAIEYIAPSTQIKEVTPTKQIQEVRPDDGIFALSKVKVNPIPNEYIMPEGELEITENGEYNVAEKASVDVAVPQPTGTKEINITANGSYTEDVINYANAEINVNIDTTKQYKHLISYTLASDAQNFTIPATEEAKKCTNFIIRFTGNLSAADWAYVGLNTAVTYYGKKITTFDFVCGLGIIEGFTFQDGGKLNRIYKTGGTGMAVSNDNPITQLNNFAFKTFTASVNILAGAQIEIYGL